MRTKQEEPFYAQTTSVSVTNTTVATSLIGSGNGQGTMTIPANQLQVGRTLRLSASGFYTSSGPTIQFQIKIGSTVILSTGAVSTVSGTNVPWSLQVDLTCRSIGVSGTIMGNSFVIVGVTASMSRLYPLVNSGAASVINTTIANLVDLILTWGTATSSITLTNARLELV